MINQTQSPIPNLGILEWSSYACSRLAFLRGSEFIATGRVGLGIYKIGQGLCFNMVNNYLSKNTWMPDNTDMLSAGMALFIGTDTYNLTPQALRTTLHDKLGQGLSYEFTKGSMGEYSKYWNN